MSIPVRYNIGANGAGCIARAHKGFLRETGRAHISWIAARNPEYLDKVRGEFKIPDKTADYRDILNDPSVDLVLFATRPEIIRNDLVRANETLL